jgi:hypothetical protein
MERNGSHWRAGLRKAGLRCQVSGRATSYDLVRTGLLPSGFPETCHLRPKTYTCLAAFPARMLS